MRVKWSHLRGHVLYAHPRSTKLTQTVDLFITSVQHPLGVCTGVRTTIAPVKPTKDLTDRQVQFRPVKRTNVCKHVRVCSDNLPKICPSVILIVCFTVTFRIPYEGWPQPVSMALCYHVQVSRMMHHLFNAIVYIIYFKSILLINSVICSLVYNPTRYTVFNVHPIRLLYRRIVRQDYRMLALSTSKSLNEVVYLTDGSEVSGLLKPHISKWPTTGFKWFKVFRIVTTGKLDGHVRLCPMIVKEDILKRLTSQFPEPVHPKKPDGLTEGIHKSLFDFIGMFKGSHSLLTVNHTAGHNGLRGHSGFSLWSATV